MRDVYEVLREKENAAERVRREVEALRSMSPWLADETATRSNIPVQPSARMEAATETNRRHIEALRTAASLLADETYDLADKIRALRISPAQRDTKRTSSAIPSTVIETTRGQTIPTAPFISSVSRRYAGTSAAAPGEKLPVPRVVGSETSSAVAASSAWVPSFCALDEAQEEVSSGTKNGLAIALVTILVIGVAAYFTSHEKRIVDTSASNAEQVQAVPNAAPPTTPAAHAPSPGAQEQPATRAASESHVSRQSSRASTKPSPSTKSASPLSTEEDAAVVPPKVEPIKPNSDLSSSAAAKAAPLGQTLVPAPAPLNITGTADADERAFSNFVAATPVKAPKPTPEVLNTSQGVAQGLLIKRVQPIYPLQALTMRIEGSVLLQATISKGGSITNVKLVSGNAALGRAAMDAVRHWEYKPYYLNGEPVEIQTQITVNFKLTN